MKTKLFAILLGILCFAESANAIPVVSGARGWWGYSTSNRNTNGSYNEFVIAGGQGKLPANRGTWDDEYGAVAMVARTIVERGGYFCPVQIQCANTSKKTKTWTVYYEPTGYSGKCVWLCQPPYTGVNCASTATTCDATNYTKSGKFAGLSMKTTGKGDGSVENSIPGFDEWGNDPEVDIILGITKFMANGVEAQPVRIQCGRNNWNSVDSYIENISAAHGTKKLLCASGYKANAAGTACEPNTSICTPAGTPAPAAPPAPSYCSGWTNVGYNAANHNQEMDGTCMKFFCKEAGTAFPSAGNFTCAPCGDSLRNGTDTSNGTCVQCQVGQAFNKTTNKCVTATAFSQPDMQYGKGKTQNNTQVSEQCWTKITPAEYKACMGF